MLVLDSELFGRSRAERGPPEASKLQALAGLAQGLASELRGDVQRFAQLDAQLKDARFVARLLELPLQLAGAGQLDSALSIARGFAFIAPDTLRGDEALILARAGLREEALALVASNLAQAQDIPSAEAKAGDAYRALGEVDSAEAYYLRSLSESKTSLERSEAVVRLVSLFSDTGRERDAATLLQAEHSRLTAPAESPLAPDSISAKPGRNQPCPCGSGKKYKKCHGAER
jgi:uncharacterized protein YchJ